jgi:hypothetical protein
MVSAAVTISVIEAIWRCEVSVTCATEAVVERDVLATSSIDFTMRSASRA